MIREFALDPELFCQWEHHLGLRNQFGVDKGRLIAEFPRKWKGLLREQSEAQEQAGVLGPIRAESIRNWLTVPTGQSDARFVRRGLGYDGNKSWRSNAQEQAREFDVVLSHQEIGAPNALRADEAMNYLSDPKFDVKTQDRVRRDAAALVDCLWPLIRISDSIKIIEPNFNPIEVRFMNPFVKLIDRLHSESSSIRLVELHVLRSNAFCDRTLHNYRYHIDPVLRSGYQVKVFFWADDRERLHDRYLLTNRGGIDITWGWDEGGPTETTPVKILEPHMWQQEWNRYCIGSSDFNIDPARHVIVVGR